MKKRALFLDRDGVINIDKVHTYKIEDFEFQDGIFNLCKKNELKDYIIIVITNQSGISRKIYTEDDYHILTKFMLEKFKEKNIDITKVYYCPYHPDFPIKKYKNLINHRKPNPGMILDAKEEFNIDLENSVLIGDNLSDIQAGINAGIKKNILISDEIYDSKNRFLTVKDLSENSIRKVLNIL